MEKCKFVYNEIDYLGYRINKEGIRPNNEHTKAIQEYPTPIDHASLERCLGLFNFFRRFVYNFSRIAKPLTELKKMKEFKWTKP